MGSKQAFCADWSAREEALADLDISSAEDLEFLKDSISSMSFPSELAGSAADLDKALEIGISALRKDPSAMPEELMDNPEFEKGITASKDIAAYATNNC